MNRFSSTIIIGFALMSGGCSANSKSTTGLDTTDNELMGNIDDQTLLQKDDLVLIGSFRVPQLFSDDDTSRTLAYAGIGLTYNPSNHSLFITAHDHRQLTAEISIPEILPGSPGGSLPSSTFLREPFDATNGQLESLLRRSDGFARIGGYLITDNRLLVSGYHFYDTEQNQIYSHFQSGNISAQTYSISPPFRLSTTISPRWSGGAMTHIPPQWQRKLGGQYLSGIAGLNIVSNASAGPTVTVFSDSNLNGSTDARLALGYPIEHPLAPLEEKNNTWNLTSQATGVVFPADFNSVLFIGRHGVGNYCYGSGEECGDPESQWQGTHAHPYRYQVWAYNANDLARVATGGQAPHKPRPYSIWALELPYRSTLTYIGGAAWDEEGDRLYVSQLQADGAYPLIHVYSIKR